VPITIFDTKRIPANASGGKHVTRHPKPALPSIPLKGGVRVVLALLERFQRNLLFAPDGDTAEIN